MAKNRFVKLVILGLVALGTLLLSVYQMSLASETLSVIKLNTLKPAAFAPVAEVLEESGWAYRVLENPAELNPQTTPKALFPVPQSADAADIEALKAYLGAGGKLILIPPSDGEPDEAVKSLFEAAGLSLGAAGYTTQDTGLKWKNPVQSKPGVQVTDTLGVGAQMFAVDMSKAGGGNVLARWNDEYAAIISTEKGALLNWPFGIELVPEVNAFALAQVLGVPWPPEEEITEAVATTGPQDFYASPRLKSKLAKLAFYETRLNDAIEMSLKLGLPMPVKEAQKLMLESDLYKTRFVHELKHGNEYQAERAFDEAERLLARASLLTTFSPRVEGRAIWLDRGTIVRSGSAVGLKKIMQKIAESGINVVYFETVNAGFPVYPSKIAMQNPSIEGWDPLKAAVEEGHRLGIEVHAWVWVFAVGNTRHNPIIGRAPDYSGPVLNEGDLMGEALRNAGGGLKAKGTQHEFWLSPASPKARQYLKDLFAEIVTNYEVDGLHLDYIRYPFQSSSEQMGYEPVGRQRFYASTHIPLPAGSEQARKVWTAWKTYQVSSFVKEVSEQMRKIDPEIKLSAAVFPMPRASRILAIQQDWETWLENGWIDTLSPMSYTSSPRKLRNTFQSVASSARKKSIIYPGIAIDRLDAQDLLAQVNTIREKGALGNTLFAMAHLDNSKADALKDGPYRESKTLTPHKDPLRAVTVMLNDFAQKYETLARKNTLTALNDEERAALSAQFAEVKSALAQAATEKETNGNVSVATARGLKEKITALNGPVQLWFAQDHDEHPYRVLYFSEMLTRIGFLMDYLEDHASDTVVTTPVEEFTDTSEEEAVPEAEPAKEPVSSN